MHFTKSALELTVIASIRKAHLELNHAILAKSHSLKSCKLVSLCIPCKQLSDAGDERELLFNIIYVCKSIVFLCFRS